MQENKQVHLPVSDGQQVQAQPPKRAYSISEWQRDFARAFAAAVPLEAVRTQARGPLLAADNDEGEPDTFAAIEAEANADARKAAEELEAAYLAGDRARNDAKATAHQREDDAALRRQMDAQARADWVAK